MAMTGALRRMGHGNVTMHGFRSSFSDWAAEHGYDRELTELCLAHKIGNSVSQAYQRSTLLKHRRVLMEMWGRWCAGIEQGVVLPLRKSS